MHLESDPAPQSSSPASLVLQSCRYKPPLLHLESSSPPVLHLHSSSLTLAVLQSCTLHLGWAACMGPPYSWRHLQGASMHPTPPAGGAPPTALHRTTLAGTAPGTDTSLGAGNQMQKPIGVFIRPPGYPSFTLRGMIHNPSCTPLHSSALHCTLQHFTTLHFTSQQ